MSDFYDWQLNRENERGWYRDEDRKAQLEAEEEKEDREHKMFDLVR